jgi:putative PIG3 family NAD(P)H quinone oxidoreductase
MKAIKVIPGEPPKLVLSELPVPEPGAGQVLIKVAAVGLNRADLLQAAGRYPPPKGSPETLGLEVSGTVAALGAGVSGLREDGQICALLTGGGYAEYALASALCVLPVPKGVSLRDAAALPEVFFTVWTNVFDSARLQPRETFLVHGGTSGIGTAAIQLMHARGHRVFTTAGSAEKCAVCMRLGAVRAINYSKEDFVAIVMAETGNLGVDVILDMVGGDYVQRNLSALAFGGRLVNIAYQKGARAEVDFRIMQARHLTMTATGLRFRSDEEKSRIRDALEREVWPLLGQGRIRPVIDSTFPLAEVEKAHARLANSGHIGKILLTL